MDQPPAPKTEPWSRAAEMLAAILAIVGSAALLAAGKVYPAGWAREVRKHLKETEGFVRALLLEEARKLKVRLFKPRGPRPPPAMKIETVKLDPLAFRRAMLDRGLIRISFPLSQDKLPPGEWNVRFCAMGRVASERLGSHAAPASSRPVATPPSAKPAIRPPEFNEHPKPAGSRRPRGPRSEPKGPTYIGDVRIYKSRYNEAREEAWAAYWLTPVDQKVEPPEPEVRWIDAMPLARRVEALRRVLADPGKYARLAARRLRTPPSTIADAMVPLPRAVEEGSSCVAGEAALLHRQGEGDRAQRGGGGPSEPDDSS